MSYGILSETKPKARKDYRCIWCQETIFKGEIHVHEISVFDGNFQDHRWHVECDAAAAEHFKDEEEFYPGEYKRGSFEHK